MRQLTTGDYPQPSGFFSTESKICLNLGGNDKRQTVYPPSRHAIWTASNWTRLPVETCNLTATQLYNVLYTKAFGLWSLSKSSSLPNGSACFLVLSLLYKVKLLPRMDNFRWTFRTGDPDDLFAIPTLLLFILF